jgi:hypothetical protein
LRLAGSNQLRERTCRHRLEGPERANCGFVVQVTKAEKEISLSWHRRQGVTSHRLCTERTFFERQLISALTNRPSPNQVSYGCTVNSLRQER